MIYKGFKTLANGFYKCELCGTILDNERECIIHMRDVEDELEG